LFPISVLGIFLSSFFDLDGNAEPTKDQVVMLEIVTWQLKAGQD